jgi:hypothetical protein
MPLSQLDLFNLLLYAEENQPSLRESGIFQHLVSSISSSDATVVISAGHALCSALVHG